MSWKIDYQGVTLVESDVTAAHLTVVGELLGEEASWAHANPMASPRVLCAWVALMLAQRHEQPLELAMAFVVSRPVAELVDAVTSVDDPPLRVVADAKAG